MANMQQLNRETSDLV